MQAPIICNDTMRFFEFKKKQSVAPTKPQTPAQARITALQRQKDNASLALQAERKRQLINRANQALINFKNQYKLS